MGNTRKYDYGLQLILHHARYCSIFSYVFLISVVWLYNITIIRNKLCIILFLNNELTLFENMLSNTRFEPSVKISLIYKNSFKW